MAEAWGFNSPTDKWVIFHTSYLIVMRCHLLTVFVAVVFTLVFAIGLAETTPTECSHGERFFICFLLSLLSRMHNYWSGFPFGPPSLPPVIYVCMLLRQEVLLLRLYFSMLNIPVQALSLGHALTSHRQKWTWRYRLWLWESSLEKSLYLQWKVYVQ
jgi:hypothetical protein